MILKMSFFSFLLAFPMMAYSQLFSGGVQAGLAGCQVAGDTYSGYNKAGVSAGAWIGVKLTDNQSLQFEMMYLQKGSRHNPNFRKEDYTSFLIQLGYIEMPLNYRIDLGNKIILSAGPSVGILAHSREMLDLMPHDVNRFNRTDISVNAGVSYKISERMQVSLRTFNSVLPIKQNPESMDRWRLFSYGKFNDLLLISLSRKL